MNENCPCRSCIFRLHLLRIKMQINITPHPNTNIYSSEKNRRVRVCSSSATAMATVDDGLTTSGAAKIMPSLPLHNPRLIALVTQYFFFPRVTPLEFLRREYSSLIPLGM
jgi:hypothetical protein